MTIKSIEEFETIAKTLTGTLEVTITYLEMHHRPTRDLRTAPHERIAVLHADKPTASFYRYLYNHVGEPWLWYERRAMDNETLCSIIHHPAVSVYVLYWKGVPAGYVELTTGLNLEIELSYFGLFPEFIGRGLGSWLLDWTLDTAWSREPSRIWVNTCNLDHPKALLCYQRAGFKPYRQETIRIRDPRLEPYWDTQLPLNSNSQ